MSHARNPIPTRALLFDSVDEAALRRMGAGTSPRGRQQGQKEKCKPPEPANG